MNVLLISFFAMCGVVSLFLFLEKTKQKIVVALESLRFSATKWRYPPSPKAKVGYIGRSPQQSTLCVINGDASHE